MPFSGTYEVNSLKYGNIAREPGIMILLSVSKMHDKRCMNVMIVNSTHKTVEVPQLQK